MTCMMQLNFPFNLTELVKTTVVTHELGVQRTEETYEDREEKKNVIKL